MEPTGSSVAGGPLGVCRGEGEGQLMEVVSVMRWATSMQVVSAGSKRPHAHRCGFLRRSSSALSAASYDSNGPREEADACRARFFLADGALRAPRRASLRDGLPGTTVILIIVVSVLVAFHPCIWTPMR